MEVEQHIKDLEAQAQQRFHEELMGQIEVNKVEASHRSVLVAGWRPGLGWVGVAGAAAAFVIIPLVSLGDALFSGKPIPEYDIGQLMVLVTGMLGLSWNRSFDKIKGVASDAPLGKPVVESVERTTVDTTPPAPVAPLMDQPKAFDFEKGE